jgi:hypothetical protein
MSQTAGLGFLSVLAQDRPDSGAMKCCPDVKLASKIGHPPPQQHEELEVTKALPRSTMEMAITDESCTMLSLDHIIMLLDMLVTRNCSSPFYTLLICS